MGPGQEPHGVPDLQASGTLPFGYSRHDDAPALQDLTFSGVCDVPPQGQPLLTDTDTHNFDLFFGQINADSTGSSFGGGFGFDLNWLGDEPGDVVLAASSIIEHEPEKQEIFTQASLVPGDLYQQHLLQQQQGNTPRQSSSQHQQHQIFQSHSQSQSQHQLQLNQNQQQRQIPLDLGHQAHQSFGLTLASDLNPSPDVLAAASALYPNQNINRPIYYGAPPPQLQVMTTMAPPYEPIHHQHQPYAVYGVNQTPLAISPNHIPPFDSPWSLAPPAPSATRPSHPRAVPRVIDQWGSDHQFNQSSFTPANARDSTEAMLSNQMSIMECLTAVDKSAANTRASSPVASTGANIINASFYPMEPPRRGSGIANVMLEGDQQEPAKKRQKSKVTFMAEGRDEEVKDGPLQASPPTAVKPPSRRRKSSAQGPGCSMSPEGEPGAESGTKRRRSGSTAQMRVKTPRENLSEEQKRTNHIRSEQKRRGLIADGYASLTQLVPSLKENNFSKSQMLNSAADYLSKVQAGNVELEALFTRAQSNTPPATGQDPEG
ncbi:hypothetical protein B0T22DRAFT_249629 [Podospora appendiculata]|uniref:BHLH domain-containing protein n=1 Tax=Podospora appendiculata TaxID=314037 RepID=A0AAE1C8Y8_9PEZI|nr:hypothetical protein B0T22DRAFT_249629 [Podospora appendiculata]